MKTTTTSGITFATYPRTKPPPHFVHELLSVFKSHESAISTLKLENGLRSDHVLAELRQDLVDLGFDVESGKERKGKLLRPVFFGDDGHPTLQYQIDAYHPEWQCGLEVEAGRAWMGNAVYRDLIQACVMVQVDYLVLAVPNAYKFKSSGRDVVSADFRNARSLADALYGHSRMQLPYDLVLIGY